jgi:hypothetical protein
MMSYTRNLEDVMLQRVAADVPNGRNVDVGACVPLHDSNTYGLYTKGWSGIAIDPVLTPRMQAQWQQLRPRDTLIEKAMGQTAG